jgi:hypothetical protein
MQPRAQQARSPSLHSRPVTCCARNWAAGRNSLQGSRTDLPRVLSVRRREGRPPVHLGCAGGPTRLLPKRASRAFAGRQSRGRHGQAAAAAAWSQFSAGGTASRSNPSRALSRYAGRALGASPAAEDQGRELLQAHTERGASGHLGGRVCRRRLGIGRCVQSALRFCLVHHACL